MAGFKSNLKSILTTNISKMAEPIFNPEQNNLPTMTFSAPPSWDLTHIHPHLAPSKKKKYITMKGEVARVVGHSARLPPRAYGSSSLQSTHTQDLKGEKSRYTSPTYSLHPPCPIKQQ